MDKDKFDKLGELLATFVEDCDSLGFEIFGRNVENTIELVIEIKK